MQQRVLFFFVVQNTGVQVAALLCSMRGLLKTISNTHDYNQCSSWGFAWQGCYVGIWWSWEYISLFSMRRRISCHWTRHRKCLLNLWPRCLNTEVAVGFALDIARAMECLHSPKGSCIMTWDQNLDPHCRSQNCQTCGLRLSGRGVINGDEDCWSWNLSLNCSRAL